MSNEALTALERLRQMECVDSKVFGAIWKLMRDQESELATHLDNYNALVIRLGEVTARLEAADGLLLRYAIIVGELSKGLDHIDPIWGEVLQVATAYDHLKAADHV